MAAREHRADARAPDDEDDGDDVDEFPRGFWRAWFHGAQVSHAHAELAAIRRLLLEASASARSLAKPGLLDPRLPRELDAAQLELLPAVIENALRIAEAAAQPLDAIVGHRTSSLADPSKLRSKGFEAAFLRSLAEGGESIADRARALEVLGSNVGGLVGRKKRLEQRVRDDEAKAEARRQELEDEVRAIAASWERSLVDVDDETLRTELRDAFVRSARRARNLPP